VSAEEPAEDAGTLPGTTNPEAGPREHDAWLGTVRALVALVEESDARDVTVEQPGLRVRLRRSEASHRIVAVEPTVVHPPARPEARSLHEVRAPLTGIWYDAPAPGATPYAQVGSHVDVGTVIGLIETMKIFNEISADAAGRITQIHVRRADLIQVDTPLLTIDTADTADLWPHRT
jgi:biotin carboxyl carrier protein